MNTRKIKNIGITPSNNFLIHPATLAMIKQNQNNKISNNNNKNFYLIPSVNFSKDDILKFYNISYISDLENNILSYTDLTKIRLLKLILSKSNFKNLTKDRLPNIYNFLLKYYNLNNNTLNNKLKLLSTKCYEDIFKK